MIIAITAALPSYAAPVHSDGNAATFPGIPSPIDSLFDLYANFGATASAPTIYNCAKFAALFSPSGTALAPGQPVAKGTAALEDRCHGISALYSQLAAFAEITIPVPLSGRVAFSWRIVGIETRSGSRVTVPAITTFELDRFTGRITTAVDYFDPSPLSLARVTPPLDEMFDTYANFGAKPGNPTAYDCGQWARLFTSDGTASSPGTPTAKGTAALEDACKGTSALLLQLMAFAEITIPVLPPLGEPGRVAFSWRIVGMEARSGSRITVPAITTWELDASGKITSAVDFFDPSLL